MSARTFTMHSHWRIPCAPEAVYALLADADQYPQWWPQVHDAVRIDEHSGTARFRAVLPLSLRVRGREEYRDATSGVLRVRLTGDLVGWSQWRVSPARDDDPQHGGRPRSDVCFRQEVTLTKRYPTFLVWLLRPVLIANHRYMLRAGRRGVIGRLNAPTATSVAS